MNERLNDRAPQTIPQVPLQRTLVFPIESWGGVPKDRATLKERPQTGTFERPLFSFQDRDIYQIPKYGTMTETGKQSPPGCPRHPSMLTPTGTGSRHAPQLQLVRTKQQVWMWESIATGGSGRDCKTQAATQEEESGRLRKSSGQSWGGAVLGPPTPPGPHFGILVPRTDTSATQDTFQTQTRSFLSFFKKVGFLIVVKFPVSTVTQTWCLTTTETCSLRALEARSPNLRGPRAVLPPGHLESSFPASPSF